MWVDGRERTLICPGIPGAGKTVMSSIVVDYLRNYFGDKDRIGIACLFCSYKSRNEQTSADLIASLLKQLVQEQPLLPEIVKALHEIHCRRDTRPSFNELSKALRSVVDSYSRVFFVINALDELTNTDRTRKHLLHEISELQNQTRISLFATSRPIPEIEKEFQGSVSLEIRATDENVGNYLDGHISQLPSFISRSRDLKEEIKSEIIKAVNGMYISLYLTVEQAS
jgi:Cdc6-like AAA superfamily ATPase